MIEEWARLKNLWQAEAGACISAMCLCTVTNVTQSDYTYSNQVNTVIATLLQAYNGFLGNLDAMQTANGSEPGSYVPGIDSLFALDELVNTTVNNLFAVQAQAKQPRNVVLTRDSNVIYVAWQIYGLLADDSTITKIIQDNNIVNDLLIQIPKGYNILYYA